MAPKKTPAPVPPVDLHHYHPVGVPTWHSEAPRRIRDLLTDQRVDAAAIPPLADWATRHAAWVAYLDDADAARANPTFAEGALPTIEQHVRRLAARDLYNPAQVTYTEWASKTAAAALVAGEADMVAQVADPVQEVWQAVVQAAPDLASVQAASGLRATLGKQRAREMEDLAEDWADAAELVRLAHAMTAAWVNSKGTPGMGIVVGAASHLDLPISVEPTIDSLLAWAGVARAGLTVEVRPLELAQAHITEADMKHQAQEEAARRVQARRGYVR